MDDDVSKYTTVVPGDYLGKMVILIEADAEEIYSDFTNWDL